MTGRSDTPPADHVPETNTPMSGTVIPPPNPIPPPSDAGEQSDADLKERKSTRKKSEEDDGLIPGVPGCVGAAVRYVGLPLLLAALVLGAIVAFKTWRRYRRRSADSASALQLSPRASMLSRLSVDSTLAACSPPITLIRAFGQVHRKRGE